MTGHLAALAATALGATTRVAPRPRSRFEQADRWFGRSIPDSPSEVTVESRVPSMAPAVVAPRGPIAGTRVADLGRPSVATPAPVTSAARELPSRGVSSRPDVTGATAAPAFPGPRPVPREVLDEVHEPVVPSVGRQRVPDLAVPHPPSSPGRPRRASAPTAKARPSAAPPPPSRSAPAPRGVMVPPPLPASAPAPVAGAAASTRARPGPPSGRAAPDVHVTIGRLEVRGTPDAGAQRAAQRPKHSALRSLEDYGAARAGGTR